MAGVTGCSSSSISLILIMVITIALVGNYDGVAAQTTSPSSGCTSSLITLTPCLGYVTSNVSTTPPSQSCCTALSSVVKNNAACLCLLLSTNNPVNVPINTTRALSLPVACKVATPQYLNAKLRCPAPSLSAGAPGPSSFAGVGVPAPSVSAVPSKSAPTASVPISSPAPSTSTPQARSPTASVGGISPTESEQPKESAGTHLKSSTIINFLAVIVIVSIMW